MTDKIIIHPRISFNNKIIINRKEWIIPAKLLPFKNHNESESEYFVRIQIWRKEMGLPEVVFSHLLPHDPQYKDNSKPKKKLARDDYKPQYINFLNPFLVRLFEKHLDKVIDTIRFVEMLPGSDQLLKINEKKYVTEFVVQLYNN